jgi:(1->4)-alpha-D-glucan 1-alpha-D-glucosylmutase
MPEEWLHHATQWRALLLKAAHLEEGQVDSNDVYQLLQTLVGSCPACITIHDDDATAAVQDFRERVTAAARKSLREAKVHTNWNRPDEVYEARLLMLIDIALRPHRCPEFWTSFVSFVQRVARLGVNNSLAQVVLKLTAPGVPDIYQGSESWNLSMVDPDNRRAVNYELLATQLENIVASSAPTRAATLKHHLDDWQNGHIKVLVTHALLQLRKANPELFAQGSYLPLTVIGSYADEVCAFMREWRETFAIVVVTRFPARRENRADWSDTRFVLPRTAKVLTDIFSSRQIVVADELHLNDAIGGMPVAVFTATGT